MEKTQKFLKIKYLITQIIYNADEQIVQGFRHLQSIAKLSTLVSFT